MKSVKMAAMAAVIALMSTPAVAEVTSFTFGVVDMGQVMAQSEAAKDVYAQMERKRTEYQAALAKEEESLRTEEQALIKSKDKLSREEIEKKRLAFEARVAKWQKTHVDRRRTLDRAMGLSIDKLRAEAAKNVAIIAKEKNYAAVLTQDAVMISRPELDMTGEVVARLNKSIKKLPIDWSAAGADTAKKK